MGISDDWDFDYSNTVLRHVDGVLSYDTGTGAQADVGDVIRGNSSGAIGKVIARTGNTASGTLTLTAVYGRFEDNETFEVLSTLAIDDVTPSNGGFKIGDTLTGQTSGDSIRVRYIEYNFAGDGTGIVYGDTLAGSAPYFQANETLDTQDQTDVCDASAAATDNSTKLGTTQTAGTLAVPGTAQTNDSVIIHYDAGSQLVPEQAIVEDAATGATGLVEDQYGSAVVGSLRLVDYVSTGGVFTNNNTLRVQQVVNYDNQVAGQVFSVGNVVVGSVSGATGRVIAVIDDGDSTGRLILADESGTWNAASPDLIQVGGVTIAEVENTTFTLDVATLNLPNGIRTSQRPQSVGGSVSQGGIYADSASLNIVRKFNSLYTLSQDTFDELLQLDDDEALDAAFKGFAYSLVFGWRLEQGSDRFLRQGALIDTTGAEVWSNTRTQGAQNKITATAFLIDSTQPFRQPQLYLEQDGNKVEPWWLEGNIDILLKVRTRQDTRYVNPATPTLGQLIPGGDPSFGGGYAVFNREFYTSTYDATEVDGSAGVVDNVALGTQSDVTNNNQGTHQFAWDNGSAVTLVVGEEFVTTPTSGNGQKVGIVVAQTGGAGATGTVEYVLKSGTQFADGDQLTGLVSGKTFDVNEPTGFDSSNSVVAGFGVDIRFSVVDIVATPSGGTGITGTFQCGEGVLQAVTGAFGFFVELDNGTTNGLALEVPPIDVAATPSGGVGITGVFQPGERVTQAVTGAIGVVYFADVTNDVLYLRTTTDSPAAFSGDNDITGSQSGATWDAGTGATYPDPPAFSGDNDITGLISGATWDAGTGATYPSALTYDANLNNGDGNQPYSGGVSGDITGASAETIQNVYQYSKYIARAEEADIFVEGPGTADLGTVGRFFRRLKDVYSEVKPGNPFGVYTGSMAFGQGWFLNTDCIDSNDIRSFSVIDDNGVTRNPPNLQSLTVSGVTSGWRVAAYRSTGAASTTILRNEFQVGTVGGGNNQAADSTILVAANTRTVSPLPADVPDSGVLRILDPNDTGNYLRFPYASVDRTTNIFTLAAGTIGAVTGGSDLTAADNVHVVFIEEQSAGASVSNTIQYLADIPIVYKARLKGFKPFRSTGTFGSAGASLGVVQTVDTIVDLP